MKGWGPKSSVCPSKPGKPNFFGGISRDFAGISRRRPKSSSKKSLCLIFLPYNRRISRFMADLLRFIDVNAGGLRQKKLQAILHLSLRVMVYCCHSLQRCMHHSGGKGSPSALNFLICGLRPGSEQLQVSLPHDAAFIRTRLTTTRDVTCCFPHLAVVNEFLRFCQRGKNLGHSDLPSAQNLLPAGFFVLDNSLKSCNALPDRKNCP